MARESALAGNSANSSAISQPAAARVRKPCRSAGAAGANQFPVRVAGCGVAGERPDIGDIGDLVGIAIDDGAVLVAGHGDHLRHKANGDLRGAVWRFGGDNLGLVDRHEARLGLLVMLLAVADYGLEAFIDLAR